MSSFVGPGQQQRGERRAIPARKNVLAFLFLAAGRSGKREPCHRVPPASFPPARASPDVSEPGKGPPKTNLSRHVTASIPTLGSGVDALLRFRAVRTDFGAPVKHVRLGTVHQGHKFLFLRYRTWRGKVDSSRESSPTCRRVRREIRGEGVIMFGSFLN